MQLALVTENAQLGITVTSSLQNVSSLEGNIKFVRFFFKCFPLFKGWPCSTVFDNPFRDCEPFFESTYSPGSCAKCGGSCDRSKYCVLNKKVYSEYN